MGQIVLQKVDRFINILCLILIIGGGTVIHTITSLIIKSYYGDLWGYVSFLLPGVSESYLVFIQFGDNIYNYPFLLQIFTASLVAIMLILLLKHLLKARYQDKS